jgi:putative Holliday junction resolvase
MSQSKTFLALDIGERRIGVALGDNTVRIAMPFDVIEVDGKELERIARLVIDEDIDTVVVGYPRNQSGEPTAQTQYVEDFAKQLKDIAPALVFQDESLTSVLAEQQLKATKKPYSKGDIDSQAAAIIVQDYLERLP